MAWLKLVQRNHLMEMRGFFLFPMYCFHAKFLPPSHSLSALLYWVGLKLHSTIWKKIEFITIQLPYFGRKKECGGFFLQNYCKPRSFPIFWPEIKKSMGLGKSKYKENLKNYSLHMTSGWKSLHGLVTSTGKLQAWDGSSEMVISKWEPMKCSNKHQPQSALLIPRRWLVTSFPVEALLLLKLKSASNSSFCFFRNPVWLGNESRVWPPQSSFPRRMFQSTLLSNPTQYPWKKLEKKKFCSYVRKQ